MSESSLPIRRGATMYVQTAADQKADREALAEIVKSAGPNVMVSRYWAGDVADRILASDWLAALIEREHGKAVAPILALADEMDAETSAGPPGAETRAVAFWTIQLRSVLGDPAAATTHDRRPIWQRLAAEVRAGMAAKGWNQADLAFVTNTSEKHISRVLNGHDDASIEWWQATLDALRDRADTLEADDA